MIQRLFWDFFIVMITLEAKISTFFIFLLGIMTL